MLQGKECKKSLDFGVYSLNESFYCQNHYNKISKDK